MKLTETQLKKYIVEALNEYTGSAEVYSGIGAALEKCGVHGLSGEEFVEMIADAAEEKALQEFAPDYGKDEGTCNVELTVDGNINDIGGDFPVEVCVEASIALECYVQTDKGDYWTPPYSETFVSGCRKALLNIYYEGEEVYEGDITYELDSMLGMNRKRLNEEEQSVIRKIYSGANPQEAQAVLNDVRAKFGFGPYDSYVEGNDVYVEVSKDPTNDSFFYDMLNSLNDYQKNYKMVAEQKKRAVRLNEAQLCKVISESIAGILKEGDFDFLDSGEFKWEKDYESYVLVDDSCDAVVGNYTSEAGRDAKSEAIEDAKAKARETRGGSFSVFGCTGGYYDDDSLVYCTSGNRDSWKF